MDEFDGLEFNEHNSELLDRFLNAMKKLAKAEAKRYRANHTPVSIREGILRYLETGHLPDMVDEGGMEIALERTLDDNCDSIEVLSPEDCRRLNLPVGSTYATALRRMKETLEEEKS